MPRSVLIGVVVGLVLVGAGIATFAIAQQGTDRPTRTGPIVLGTAVRVGTPQTPSDEPARESCGDWGNQYVAGTAGYALAEQYGELRQCGLVGDTWVLTTHGKDDVGGVVAIYECAPADQACLDNRNDHPFQQWTILVPRYKGSVSVLNVLDNQTLIISVGTSEEAHALRLDLATKTLTDGAPSE